MTKLLEKVITAVRSAADLMKDRSFTVEAKGDKDNLVTSNDKRVQTYLYGELERILPDSGFFGEEDVTSFEEGEHVWIVDPIDGTTNYARGIRDCAISVGLEHAGEPVLGVVYCPYQDELFYAERGCGAYLNGTRIHVSDKPFENGLLCTAFSVYRKNLADTCMSIVRDAYAECADFRRFGSAAAELCYLAAGRCDLYFEIRVFPWDFAGASVILSEAGGCLCSLGGNAPSLRAPTPLIAANNRKNLDRMLSHVEKHIKEVPYRE
jgi:myo-inositol-1(or 4)-monophosphatase